MLRSEKPTMAKRHTLLLPTLFLLSLVFDFISLSSSASVPLYDNFVGCLAKNSAASEKISSIVYGPGNAAYTSVLQAYIKNKRFNTSSTPKPSIIVTPLKESHVQATVICAKSIGIQIKIRSGGHDYEGISYVSRSPFIILDMFNLRNITVNIVDETAWVQAGATLGELYYRIWQKSKVHGFPAGVCPTVGIGGHISGGGYGAMLRRHGLAVDHVLDATIVDVKGRIFDRKQMGEDLFWAIRGGGGASFGVVLAYKLRLVQVPKIVTYFRVTKSADNGDDVAGIVNRWQDVMLKIDNDLFIRLLLQPVTAKKKGEKTVRATFIALFLGDANRLMTVMNTGFPELKLMKTDCKEMTWIDSMLYWANFDDGTKRPEVLLSRNNDGVNFLKRKSDYVQQPISAAGLNLIFKKMIEVGKVGFVFNPYGGRMSEIPSTETPFPHRAGNLFKIQYSVNWKEDDALAEKNYLNQARILYSYMTPYVSKSPRGAFLNYRDLDIGVNDHGQNSYAQGKVYGTKYFMGNFDRLVKVKTMVDPENFFRNEQSIPVKRF